MYITRFIVNLSFTNSFFMMPHKLALILVLKQFKVQGGILTNISNQIINSIRGLSQNNVDRTHNL